MQIITLLILLSLSSFSYANGCAEFEAEAESFEGVVPRFDENGRLRTLLMYGEGSFLTPKRSIINDARRKAELSAKRSYAEFLKSNFNSETLSQNLIQTAQVTNQKGETAGYAEELSTTLDNMKSSSTAVLSGIVKLDECVNEEEKYVLVAMGWKPSTSQAATDVKVAMATTSGKNLNAGDAVGRDTAGADSRGALAKDKSSKTKKLAGVDLVSIEVEGFGADLKRAINDALTRAISQVFGEKFASQSNVVDTISSLSVTGDGGNSAGLAVETSHSQVAINSSIAGLINSWSYISKKNDAKGYQVILLVAMPKYKSTIDKNKSTIVITAPQVLGPQVVKDEIYTIFVNALLGDLERQINQSSSLTVLDRKFTEQRNTEISSISGSNNISELARLGNKVGADILLIPVIEKFKHEVESRKVGDTVVVRNIFDVILSSRLLEVSTSNLIDNKKFQMKNKKIKADRPSEEVGNLIAAKVSSYLISKLGGRTENSDFFNSGNSNNFKEVKSDVDQQYKKLKKDVENDW